MPHEPRLRDYLTRHEVVALLRVAKKSRYAARNHAMILLGYWHGLRASEVCGCAGAMSSSRAA